MRTSSSASASILRAFLIETSSRSGLTGFSTKSAAPACIAAMAASMLPGSVCTMTGGLRGKGAHGREDGGPVHVRHEEVEEDKRDIARAVGGERGERTVAAIGARRRDSRTA